MAYRRRRRKTSHTEIVAWFGVLIIVLISGGLVTLPIDRIVIAFIIAMIIMVFVVGGLVFWKLRQNAKVRDGLIGLSADHVDVMDPIDFEKYVGAMLAKRGFSHILYTAIRNDDGIDLTARFEGKSYAVQAKRYSKPVSKEHIFPVTSARQTLKHDIAMVVTNNYFTRGAKEYAKKSECILVDRDELARWRAENR